MHEQSIEEKAIQTYQNNLLFLQKTQVQIYEKVTALENAIEHGHYQEKYELQYKEEGYFDVLEKETQQWLYSTDSNKYADIAAKSINYEKRDNLFETFYNVYISEEDAATYIDAPITDTSYSASAQIISYANQYAQSSNSQMKKIYKFIFFGTGLGTHLAKIHQKTDSNVYFIVEDNLELFRLSLFVTDYKTLTNNGAILYFSVFDDNNEFLENAKKFFNEMFIYNQYLKYFAMLNHPEEKIKEFQKFIVGQGYLVFNYSAMTLSILRPLEHLKEGYKILDISARLLENTKLQDKPFLILGAGPSLHTNIEWLQKNQDKFLIVAVSAMLSSLEKYNIKPAIITHTHGFNDALPHVQKVKDISFFDDTILLFNTFTTPEFLSYFKKENVYLFQGTSTFKERFSGLGSSNIGALTYGLLTKFGLKNIYLLGLDFAINQETGESHADSHAHLKKFNKDKTTYALEENISYIDSVITTKGNFQESVKTNLIFNGFKKQCELFNKIFTLDDTKTYNLSNGAFVEGAIPTKITDKQITESQAIDRETLLKKIKEIFEEKSENYLTKRDFEAINNKLEYIQNIKTIIEAYKNQKYSTMNKFHYHTLGLFINILGEEANKDAADLNNVFEYYLKYVSGYIFDIINTKNLQNEKKHIKNLKKLISSELLKIVTFYQDYLENYLDEIKDKNTKEEE